MKFLFLIIQVFLCSFANADFLETATLQGNSSGNLISIHAWRGVRAGGLFSLNDPSRKNFLKKESFNIAAEIGPTITVFDKLGATTPMYVVAVVNGTAYTKNAKGQWLRWDGGLHAFEIRDKNKILGQMNIVDGLTGLTGTIDVYFGFGTKTGDVIYNKKPFTIQIAEKYEHILTVGENGTYTGCEGLKTALNIAQDSTEIRIQQGIYPCSGIEITSSKNFNKYGIKISGGWDNDFQVQSNDPSLTILEGTETFTALDGTSEGTLINVGTILHVDNRGAISVELISFQNAGSAIIGGELGSLTEIFINKCHFRKNGSTFRHRSAIDGVNTIENSLFIDNKTKGDGGAVSSVGYISNSVFINNYAQDGGGAVSSNGYIINSVFISNASDYIGGAVSGGGVISNSTFFKNSAKNSGGAVSSNSVNIQNSIFYENTADGQPNDIDSFGGGITIDYSLFNHLSGGADVGIHNINGDPLFLDSANGDYRLQTGSQAINAGDKNILRKELSYLFPRIGFNNPVDLDNKPRLQGSGIDMGAFENR